MLLFIVGTGRSGTSLLQSMLASNSKIAYLPETLFFRRFVVNNGKGTKIEHLKSKQDDIATEEFLNSDRYFIRTGMDASDLLNNQDNNTNAFPASLYRALLQKKMQLDNCQIVGDKDPKSVEHLPVIYAFESSAIVIQTVRDPRDILVSRMNAAWSKDHSLMKHLFAIRFQSRLAKKFFTKSSTKAFVKVKYENLISNPEAELTKICDKLGLEFEKGMLRFGKAAKNLISAEEYSWKKETTKDLISDNHGKWSTTLSHYQIAMTEAVCKDIFMQENYKSSNSILHLKQSEKLRINIFRFIALPAELIYICLNWIKNNRAITKINNDGGF